MNIPDVLLGSKYFRVAATAVRTFVAFVAVAMIWAFSADAGTATSRLIPDTVTVLVLAAVAADVRLAVIRWRMK